MPPMTVVMPSTQAQPSLDPLVAVVPVCTRGPAPPAAAMRPIDIPIRVIALMARAYRNGTRSLWGGM